jgi:hypothetical protein
MWPLAGTYEESIAKAKNQRSETSAPGSPSNRQLFSKSIRETTFPSQLASNLPPLDPRVSSFAHSTRSTNPRQQTIEMMQLRSLFTSQLQGLDTMQTQTLRQIEAKQVSTEQNYHPSILKLEQQSHFNLKQLETITNKIFELEGVQIPTLQNPGLMANSIFEDTLHHETGIKLGGLTEELKLHQMRVEELHKNVLTSLANASAQIKTINRKFEDADKSIADYQHDLQIKIDEITPKLQNATSKVAQIESSATIAKSTMSSINRIMADSQQIKSRIVEIREQEIQKIAGDLTSLILQMITQRTTDLDQQIMELKAKFSSITDNQQSSVQRQQRIDQSIEDQARNSIHVDKELYTTDGALITSIYTLTSKLNSAVTEIENELNQKIKDISNNKSLQDTIAGTEIATLKTGAKLSLKKLTNDWNQFHSGSGWNTVETFTHYLD